jgi:hypothetical protein
VTGVQSQEKKLPGENGPEKKDEDLNSSRQNFISKNINYISKLQLEKKTRYQSVDREDRTPT